jgi:phosphoglycolate phosphatase-like HAD superfamily hydrolase
MTDYNKWRRFLTEAKKPKPKRRTSEKVIVENKLRVFDFDGTLATSKSKVCLTKADGSKAMLDPHTFANYELQSGEEYGPDAFEEFDTLIDPQPVDEIINIMRAVIEKERNDPEGRKIAILTARTPTSKDAIKDFLEEHGLDMSMVAFVALADGDPNLKRAWIENEIRQGGFTDIEFFDDAESNIKAVEVLRQRYPNIKLRTRLIKYGRFNEAHTGTPRTGEFEGPYGTSPIQKKYQKTRRRNKPKNVGKGGNTHMEKGVKKASTKGAKAAPPGAGGS